jgi:uncharacterized delta-60 repeat protein
MKTRVLILAGILLSAQASVGFAQSCRAGQLDSKYGSNGFVQISPLFSVTTGVGGDYEGMVHDANGNVYTIVPASVDSDGDSVGATAKAAASGNRDLSFGGYGAVVPGGQPLSPYAALARDGAGNILVASTGFIGLFGPTPTDVVVVNRYSASGVVDTTYGDGVSGVATIPLDNVSAPIDLRAGSDGSAIIAASTNDLISGRRVPVAVKLKPSGVLDPAFGNGGVSSFYTAALAAQFGPTGKATDVAIQSSGKVLIAGRVGDNVTFNRFFVARLLPGGALDTTFGTSGGISVVSFGAIGSQTAIAFGRKMAVQSDGKIVVVGGLAATSGGPSTGTGVLRLTSTGQLDTTFNGTGQVTFQPGPGGINAFNLALQDNDKILLAGQQFLDASQTSGIAAVMRLTSTGQPDPTFGTGGVGTIASPLGGNSGINSVTYNSSGTIVVNVGADNLLTKSTAYLAQLDSGSPGKCH